MNALALPNTVAPCSHGRNIDECKECKANVEEYDRLNSTAKAPPRGNWKKETWRGTSNRNDRGNTKQRAKRRAWILENFKADTSTPEKPRVRCYRCGIQLSESTMTIDRITPGCQGGKYVEGNIRPACSNCNSVTGATTRSVP